MTELTYRLRCSPSSAFERLKSLARSTAEVSGPSVRCDPRRKGELKAVSLSWNEKGNRLHQDWDNTTLGTLEIDGDRLQVHVNSHRHARRIEREITKRLGADAVLESRTADSVEKLLTERKETPRDRLADLEQEQLQQQPEVREFLRQQSERYWETWLDTRLPALGNRTPRQVSRTPAGPERLEALFAEFAWKGINHRTRCRRTFRCCARNSDCGKRGSFVRLSHSCLCLPKHLRTGSISAWSEESKLSDNVHSLTVAGQNVLLAGRQGVYQADFANAERIRTFRLSRIAPTISGLPFFSHTCHHCQPFSDFSTAMSLTMSLAADSLPRSSRRKISV